MPDIVLAQNESLPAATQVTYRDMGDGTHALVVAADVSAASIFASAVYGEIYVAEGAVIQNLDTTPELLTAFTTNGLAAGVTPNVANDRIVIDEDGVYEVHFCCSFSGDANQQVHMHLRINAIEQYCGFHRELGGGDVGSASFCGRVACVAGDLLTIYAENDIAPAGKNVTVIDAQFIVRRIA